MLMLYYKTRTMNGSSLVDNGSDPLVSSVLDQLLQGLQKVVGALQNYSICFEALGGMRGLFSPFSHTFRGFNYSPFQRQLANSPNRPNQKSNGCGNVPSPVEFFVISKF